MKTEFSPTNKKKRNAKISFIFKILILLVIVPYIIVHAMYNDLSTFQLAFYLLAIAFAPISITQDNFRVNHEKLILFPTGIEYKTFTYEVFSQWDELERIEKDPSLLNNIEWIVTSSKRVKNKFLLWIWSLLQWERPSYIPVYMFAENWRDSELGQQIKQHAPHLFEKEKSA